MMHSPVLSSVEIVRRGKVRRCGPLGAGGTREGGGAAGPAKGCTETHAEMRNTRPHTRERRHTHEHTHEHTYEHPRPRPHTHKHTPLHPSTPPPTQPRRAKLYYLRELTGKSARLKEIFVTKDKPAKQ